MRPVIGFVVKNIYMKFYKICTTESLTVNTDLEIHAMHMRRRFNPIELCMSMRMSYKLLSPLPFLEPLEFKNFRV